MRETAIDILKQRAREYGIPEAEVLEAWERMKAEYHLPTYVEPMLERRSPVITLSPAVDMDYLPWLLEEVPDFRKIPPKTWPETR